MRLLSRNEKPRYKVGDMLYFEDIDQTREIKGRYFDTDHFIWMYQVLQDNCVLAHLTESYIIKYYYEINSIKI